MPLKSCAHSGCRALVPVGTVHCPCHARAEAQDRWARADAARAGQAWRRWYKLKRWRDLKEFVHDRDNWRCKWPGCGCLLRRGRSHPQSAVADHIIEHHGDPALFWNPRNIQSLCKTHHDIHKARLEGRRREPAPPPGGGSNPHTPAQKHQRA